MKNVDYDKRSSKHINIFCAWPSKSKHFCARHDIISITQNIIPSTLPTKLVTIAHCATVLTKLLTTLQYQILLTNL